MAKAANTDGKTKIDTSKKILIYCDTLTALIILAAFAVAVCGVEMSGLSEIAVAFIGLTATAHSFYFWKAKAENLHKHKLDDKISMSDNDNSYGGSSEWRL